MFSSAEQFFDTLLMGILVLALDKVHFWLTGEHFFPCPLITVDF